MCVTCVLPPPAPAPNNAQSILTTKCIDEGKHAHHNEWFEPWGEGKCPKSVSTFDDPYLVQEHIPAERIVFSMRFPLPKDKHILDMSRWFQNIMGVIIIEKSYKEGFDIDLPGQCTNNSVSVSTLTCLVSALITLCRH